MPTFCGEKVGEFKVKVYLKTLNLFCSGSFLDFIKLYLDKKIDIEDKSFIFGKDVFVTYNIKKEELAFLNPFLKR